MRKTELQEKVLHALQDGKWHSTIELNQQFETSSAGSIISRLRKFGYTIEDVWQGGNRRRYKMYRMQSNTGKE